MPEVFEGRCDGCGQDFLAAGHATGVFLNDGTVALLPHPGEDDRLRKHGFTRDEASRQGRLVLSETVICADCGSAGRRQHLSPRPVVPAPVPLVVTLIAGGITAAVWNWSDSFLLTVASVAVLVVLAQAAAEAAARRAERISGGPPYDPVSAQRAATLKATQRCKNCGGAALVPLGAGPSRVTKVRCPSCGERALSLENTWMT